MQFQSHLEIDIIDVSKIPINSKSTAFPVSPWEERKSAGQVPLGKPKE
jgi:hypothetical protein